jgi:hypothetical protein
MKGESTDNSSMTLENMSDKSTMNIPDFDNAIGGTRGKIGRGRICPTDMNGRVVGARNRSNGWDPLGNSSRGRGQAIKPK